ncbi:MAG: LPS export ABC transporter periplasmic protein LptC [Deltaproteobacteria bacterium]|nr:LPS export ABC transporter periplasmic protein LptC [Deltaproteobacteria bacterium]
MLHKVTPLGLVIVGVVVLEFFILIPRTIRDAEKKHFLPPAEDVDLSIQGFRAANLNADGQKETVEAKEAELYQQQGFVILKEVTARIYAEGDHVIHVRGKRGKYFLNTKDIEFFGDIIVTSENLGYELKTEYLKYAKGEKVLSSHEPIWFAGPNPQTPSLEVTAKGMHVETRKEELKLLSQVHCKKFDEDAENIDVQSDKATVYLNKNKALFVDNVVVTQRDMNIFSDRFLMAYNKKNKSIDRAEASQNVKIVQEDRVASCQKALFLNRKQKIILTGNPRVVQGGDSVSAKVVIFFTAENKILFDEAVGEVKELGLEGF